MQNYGQRSVFKCRRLVFKYMIVGYWEIVKLGTWEIGIQDPGFRIQDQDSRSGSGFRIQDHNSGFRIRVPIASMDRFSVLFFHLISSLRILRLECTVTCDYCKVVVGGCWEVDAQVHEAGCGEQQPGRGEGEVHTGQGAVQVRCGGRGVVVHPTEQRAQGGGVGAGRADGGGVRGQGVGGAQAGYNHQQTEPQSSTTNCPKDVFKILHSSLKRP